MSSQRRNHPFDSDTESRAFPQLETVKRQCKGVKQDVPSQGIKKKVAKNIEPNSESDSELEVEARKKKSRKPAEKRKTTTEVKKQKKLRSEYSSKIQDSSDSEEEENPAPIIAPKLQNLLWRRVASGYTSQRNFSRTGEFYIDFRISYSSDAQLPDGYKKSLLTLKTCADTDSDIYKAAEKLIKAAKKEYKDITPLLYPKQD